MAHTRKSRRGIGTAEETSMTSFRFARVAILSVVLCSLAAWSWGQGAQGTVVGTASDATGAMIAGASVTITNTTTNVSVHTKTTVAGDFTVPYLSPGVYSVSVLAPGFERGVVEGITVGVGQTVRADAHLKLGKNTESVVINSSATTSLDTDSMAVGQVISQEQVNDLPMENRGFASLMLLSPGAMTPIQDRGADNINSSGVGNDYVNISGARADANGYTIDGMTNDTPYWNNTMINLSLDAIQEFKEVSATYSAAYGAYASQIIVSSKSGGNDLHGTLFEYVRNNAFDAVSAFTPPGPVPPLRQNDYGYSLGGPVYIPKVYNGHNRTFFFANFERLKSANSSTLYSIAPTSAELQGTVASTNPIIDPTTGLPFAQDSSGNYLIPAARWSRLATVANAATPGTVFPVAGAFANGTNSVAVVTNPNINNQQTYRVDQTIDSKDTLNARVTLANAVIGDAAANSYASFNTVTPVQSWNVIETHTFNDHFINNARVGLVDWANSESGTAASSADISTLGLQNTFAAASASAIFPQIQFGGFFSNGGGALGPPEGTSERIWNFEDSITWVHGRHSVTAGFLATIENNLSQLTDLLGVDVFQGSYTSALGTTPTSGNAWADFLLGDIASGQAVIPTAWGVSHPKPLPWFIKQNKYAPYVNDDWRVNSRLTLNLGLRYDFIQTPNVENALWGSLSVPGGVVCVTDNQYIASGDGGSLFQLCPRGPSPKRPFAPRVGFEFRPFASDSTVVRGGYGLFVVPYTLHEYDSNENYPWAETFSAAGYNFNQLYPALTTIANSTDVAGLDQAEPPTTTNPYIQQWSFGVQREVAHNMKVDVGYVGSMGTHLETRLAANQPFGYSATDTPEQRMMRYPYYNFGTYGLNGTPFSPGFLDQGNFTAASNYNSLQTSLNYRAKDVSLLASFTWASSMDDASASEGTGLDNAGWQGPMDAHDIQRDYAKSSFDVNKRLAISAVYQLPVGRGKKFGSEMNRAADLVVGGWQVNGIYTAQGGIPFDVAANDIGGVLLADAQRANKLGSAYPAGFQKSASQWFNIASYVQPAEGAFGTEPRDDIRAPGVDDLDFSIFKNFQIWERAKFQLRGEAFNATNHVELAAPTNTVGASNNGVISGVEIPGRIIQIAGKIIF
jgi:hypothetical protein